MEYKNLYINGCSFTAGHTLDNEHRWSEILSSKLNTKLFNRANNGQSMDSIFLNSILHLNKLTPEDTLVIIGLTWTPRHGTIFNNSLFNISPAHIERSTNYTESGFKSNNIVEATRRFAPTKLTYGDEEFKKERDIFLAKLKSFENLTVVMDKFIDYHRALVKYQDEEVFMKNDRLNYISKVIALQSYLKEKKFNYKIIQFPYDFELFSDIDKTLVDEIDFNNVIKFHIGASDLISFRDESAHPTLEHNKILVSRILESL